MAARLSQPWHYSLKKDVTGTVEGHKCKALQRRPHLLGEKGLSGTWKRNAEIGQAKVLQGATPQL